MGLYLFSHRLGLHVDSSAARRVIGLSCAIKTRQMTGNTHYKTVANL